MKTTYIFSKEQGKMIEKFKAPIVIWHEPWSTESLNDLRKCLEQIDKMRAIGVEGIRDYYGIVKV